MLMRDFYYFYEVGDIGIEVEVEATKYLPNNGFGLWRVKEEGSLRGHAAEYVTRGSISLGDASGALAELCEKLLDPDCGTLLNSPRTSLHVHHNILDMTPTQVWTAVVAYWLVETPLFNYCNPNRSGNKFCLRLKDAEAVLDSVYEDLKGTAAPFLSLQLDRIRYAALNLSAVPNYGSLELRGMDGRINHKDMYQWCLHTHKLIQRSKTFKNPSILMDAFFVDGPAKMLDALFDADFISLIKKRKWDEAMRDSAETLAELAYFHSWDKYESRLEDCVKFLRPQPLPRIQGEPIRRFEVFRGFEEQINPPAVLGNENAQPRQVDDFLRVFQNFNPVRGN